MRSAKKLLWAFSLLVALLISATGNVFAVVSDDYMDDEVPDVTARVGRISFITGDVQIRRSDSRDWETAVLNLPIVEGDEVATSGNALLEIQLGKDAYLRLSQSSFIKFLNLKDEGIAVSLSEGTVSVRLFEFDKEQEYFEIDAPATTVALQKDGLYRIDAQDARSREKAVRVTVGEDGEARIYSMSSGFTLRSGRSAKVFLEGDYAGEWELANAADFYDEFDEWVAKSDAAVIKRMQDAFYDKYYDRDIYGAEDLNDYGEWIYTRQYGYVWRPYRSVIDYYPDWSPYRYGHWRWIPPFGWTWVNDEPWGWATYHHGRWIFIDGYWVWTPYALVRTGRSWWRPALIILGTWGNNIYWCPLPYNYSYYNYNRHYHRRKRRDGRGNNPPPNNPPNNPTTGQNPPPDPANIDRGTRKLTPPLQSIPPTGVVTVPTIDFGRISRGFSRPPADTAKEILTKTPDPGETPPILPDIKDLDGKISKEILAQKPRVVRTDPNVKIGAGTRTTGAPLDKELEQKRIFGNRTPVTGRTNNGQNGGSADKKVTDLPDEPVRRTGAVNRPALQPRNEPTRTVLPNPVEDRKVEKKENAPPVYAPQVEREERRSQPRVEQPRTEPKYEPPVRPQPPRSDTPRTTPPRITPQPKSDPPPRNDTQRNNPPPRNDTPRNNPPPKSDTQRSDPPKKSDPPPQNSRPSLSNSRSKRDG